MTNFTDLGLDPRILKALESEGYTSPTPIQAQAIPPVMQGSDLLGIAQTGTGKTAAFALPILHRLAADRRQPPRRGCRVLVLSPTRELASQIADSFRAYGRNLGITVAVVFGGVGHRPQIQAMARGVDVLVATPGRLLDHTGERNIALSGTEIFVLDEADQMLDLGFLQPIRKVVGQLSAKRQNLFFSATMPSEIGKLAGELLHNPVKVSVAPAATTAERVSQRVIHVERHGKRAILVELLADADLKRTLVFTRTKRGADKVAEHLQAHNIRSAAIHGNKSQGQRERALDQFRRSDIRVLVATDIAARGIDIDQVSHVINFELPEVPEAYVHRIGRTARAGAAGIAISLCDPEERSQLREIERLTRQSIPHENRISGEAVPLDATGAPRGRHNGRPQREARGNGGRPHGGQRRDGHDRRAGEDRNQRAAHRQPRHEAAPRNEEATHRAPRRPDDRGAHRATERSSERSHDRHAAGSQGGAPRHRDHATPRNGEARSPDRSRDDRSRDRGSDRQAKGAGGAPRHRDHAAPRNGEAGRTPHRDGKPARGGQDQRTDYRAPRQDDRPRGGKPGGHEGLKRRSSDKGIWTNRP